MLRLKLVILLLLTAICTHTQCCLKFQGRICVGCPTGTHLYRGSCLNDIENCIAYKDGFDCQKCVNGFQINQNGECVSINQSQEASNQFTDTIIDFQQLRGPVPQSMNRAIDYFISKNAGLKNLKPIKGSIRSYKNGTNQISLQFRDNNNIFKGLVSTNQQGTVFQQLSFNQGLTVSSFDVNNNNLNYITVDLQADQIYPVVSDFIGFSQPEFAKLQPIKVMRAFDSQSIYYYKLTYVLPDGSSWELSANFNIITIIVNYQGKIQISSPNKTNPLTSIQIQPRKIMEDLYFIMVYDSINKQFNNKYSQSVIRSVTKSEDVSNIRYVVNFQQSSFVWEITGQINKNTFTITGIQQNRKQSISPITSGIILINPQVSNKNTSSSIPVSLNNQILTNTSGNLNPSVLNPSNPSTPSTPSTPSPPSNLPNSSTPNPPSNPPTPNPPSNPPSNPPTTPNPSTPNPSTPNPSTPNPPTPQTVPRSINLPQRILATVANMTQIPTIQFTSSDFQPIDQLIRQVNVQSLTNGNLIAAYFTPSSFSRNYFVYYQKGLQIFEARVTRDMVRKRSYIIGFNKVA